MLTEIKRRINDVGAYSLHGNGRLVYMGTDLGIKENIANLSHEAFDILSDVGETLFCFLAGRGFITTFQPLMNGGVSAVYPTTVCHFIETSKIDIPARFQLLYSLLSGNTDTESVEARYSNALLYITFLTHFNLSRDEIVTAMDIITEFGEEAPYRSESLNAYIIRLSRKSSIINRMSLTR